MHDRLIGVGVVAALSIFAIIPVPATGQSHEVCGAHQGRCLPIKPPNVPYGPTAGKWKMPRTPDGKPDFTGVWAGPGFTHQVGPNDTDTPIIRNFDAKKMAPLTALGEKELFRPTTGDLHIDDPIGLCLPYGFNSQMLVSYAQQWIQSPKYLVIRHEFMNNFSRVIPLDGSPHPKDLDLTWGGDSVGHWEGDTLVIDTVGLKEWWLDNPHPAGSLWHSDAEHVIERVKWVGPQVASYDVTIDDPKYFTRPWTEEFHMVLHPTWRLLEYVCNENDRCSQGNCVQSDAQKPK